jgi:hypothetical protein
MDPARALVMCLLRPEGLGAARKVAARTPSPSSPAFVNRPLDGRKLKRRRSEAG